MVADPAVAPVRTTHPPDRTVARTGVACLAWCGLVTADKVGRTVAYTVTDSAAPALLELANRVAQPHAQHLASYTRIGPDWV